MRILSMGMVLTFIALAAAADNPADKNPAPAQNQNATLFKTKCATCHGPDAKGSVALARTLLVPPAAINLQKAQTQGKTDEELAVVITKGRKNMPSFAGLKKEEISGLVGFLRSLSPKLPPEKK